MTSASSVNQPHGKKKSKPKKSRENPRRMASWILRDLYNTAKEMRDSGVIFSSADCAEWLLIFANVLSSCPPPRTSGKRGKVPPTHIVLSVETLTRAMHEAGFKAYELREEIADQVAKTRDWRAKQSKPGQPHYVRIDADTIGKKLSITDEIRRAAKAWNLGTVGGSPEARAEAYSERERLRHEANRRDAGAMPREQYLANSLSRQRPWEAEGISERTWRRWKREGKPAARNADSGRSTYASDKRKAA